LVTTPVLYSTVVESKKTDIKRTTRIGKQADYSYELFTGKKTQREDASALAGKPPWQRTKKNCGLSAILLKDSRQAGMTIIKKGIYEVLH
jgi:hypothetical protein